ncbi:MAG: hypothetical protein ACOCG5_00615 [Candidatus Alkaliphilus sp. MAG34]
MKRIINYSIAFIGVFIVTYLIFCYLPSFRIKLFAPPTEYFVESIKHMVLLKTLVSACTGLLVSGLLFAIKKRA